jgi:uncharacterized protein
MSLTLNLLDLQKEPRHLEGALPAAELALGFEDDLLHFDHPLEYALDAEHMGDAVLVQGTLRLPMQCDCARCLKPFRYELVLEGWAAHLPLTGDDKVSQNGDLVDLTPYMREDIVLALPQHPVCGAGCGGIKPPPPAAKNPAGAGHSGSSEAWAALDRLKLK